MNVRGVTGRGLLRTCARAREREREIEVVFRVLLVGEKKCQPPRSLLLRSISLAYPEVLQDGAVGDGSRLPRPCWPRHQHHGLQHPVPAAPGRRLGRIGQQSRPRAPLQDVLRHSPTGTCPATRWQPRSARRSPRLTRGWPPILLSRCTGMLLWRPFPEACTPCRTLPRRLRSGGRCRSSYGVVGRAHGRV